jgi:hypothetical protein
MSYFRAALAGKVRRLAVCLALAAAGAGVARLLQPGASHACVCLTPNWDVTLTSVEASEGAPDHTRYWLQHGELTVGDSGGQERASLLLADEAGRHVLTIEAFHD